MPKWIEPPDKCVPECKGALHVPSCPKFIKAMQTWDPPKPPKKKQPGGHGRSRKERGLPPQTPEERRIQNKENGMKGGRPPGPVTYTRLPLTAVKALQAAKLRVRQDLLENEEIGQAVGELAGYALERTAMVLGGKVSAAKAPSVLKAAIQIRQEVCTPVEQVHKIGGFDIAAAVDAAGKKKAGK